MSNGYRKVKISGKTYLLHRLIWELEHGPIPVGHIVHHKDENKLNNSIDNLELVEHAEHVRGHRLADGALPPSQKGLKRALQPITCAVCGISALRAVGNHNKHGERYCSRACSVKASNARRTA